MSVSVYVHWQSVITSKSLITETVLQNIKIVVILNFSVKIQRIKD